MEQTVGEIVRKAENEYTRGNTQLSRYVDFSMWETLNKTDAYINSRHVSGAQDSMGRDKPFFNIVTAAINVWYRATDIDRSNIRIRATKSTDFIDSFLATVHLQEWMRKERFGQFLNEWGRVLARYGSAVVKFVKDSDGLHISVVPWQQLIVDAVDFDSNPKIEIIELTEAQLRQRIDSHGYDKDAVESLLDALTERSTIDNQKKDNKSGYIKLYEVHGLLSKQLLTENDRDENKFVQQVHVISFVGKRNGRKTEYDDFTLYKGEEETDPYMITHLIKEEGRTLSIGAVERLFQAQWMTNHAVKNIKDTLDLSSKLVYQTADNRFVGHNVLTNIQTGDILLHNLNMPLTKVDTSKTDIVGMQNFAVMWKQLGNEINGISEAMLGAQPKAGSAWRQTEALLQESYSLFELMTENKGLDVETMLRTRIIPYIKRTNLNNADEIATTLQQYDIQRIDGMYIKAEATRQTNKQLVKDMIAGELPTPEGQMALTQANTMAAKESLQPMGNKRFFKPSEIDGRTWKTQLKDLEWEVEIEVTGEQRDTQAALTTLNTALQLVLTPGFDQNEKAKAMVGRILELTGTMSPLEYTSLPDTPSIPLQPGAPGQSTPTFNGGPTATPRNI